MPGTFSQIYIQIVFSVQYREKLLQKPWHDDVFKYISSIIKAKNQKPIIVNGVEDHVHIFLSIKPSIAISDLVRDIKNNSSKFINEQKFISKKFQWQEGYGAFSYSHSQLKNVYNYIATQEEHHGKKSFEEEYREFLKLYDIDIDEKYIF